MLSIIWLKNYLDLYNYNKIMKHIFLNIIWLLIFCIVVYELITTSLYEFGFFIILIIILIRIVIKKN